MKTQIKNLELKSNANTNCQIKNNVLLSTDREIYIRANIIAPDGEYRKGYNVHEIDNIIDVPTITTDEQIEVNVPLFITIIDDLKRFVCKDELRPQLCGIYFDGINAVATDANVIKYTPFNINVGILPIHKYIKQIKELIKIFNDNKITVKQNDKYVQFSGIKWDIIITKIDGEFPQYKNVFPDKTQYDNGFIITNKIKKDIIDMSKAYNNKEILFFNKRGNAYIEDKDTNINYTNNLQILHGQPKETNTIIMPVIAPEENYGINIKLLNKITGTSDVVLWVSTQNKSFYITEIESTKPKAMNTKPKAKTISTKKDIEIIDYSDKSFAVIGNTKPIKNKLKLAGGRFNPYLKCGKGWIFSKSKIDKVNEII